MTSNACCHTPRTAEINYDYNRSNVRSNELRDDDMKEMKTFLSYAADHDSVMLKAHGSERLCLSRG